MNHEERLEGNRPGSRLLSEAFPQIQSNKLLQNICGPDNQILQKILEFTPLIIWIVNREGTITFSEGGGLKNLGFLSEDWLGKSIFQEFKDDPEMISRFHRTLEGEESQYEMTMGDLILDVEYTPLHDSQNDINSILLVAIDISEKVRSQEELRRSEERFSKIFQVNPIAMCITEIDTSIFVEVNQNFLTALQCKREEIIGKSAFDIGFWPSNEKRKEMIEKVINEGTASDLYFDFLIPNGTRLCTMLSAVQIYFRGETFLLSCVKDITREQAALEELEKLNENLEARVASRTAELEYAHKTLNDEYTKRNRLYSALQQTEARWRSLVTNAPDTILTLDFNGTILYINHQIVSPGFEKVIGSSIYIYMQPSDILEAKTILKTVFETGATQVMETKGLNTNGKKAYYSCRVGAMVSNQEIIAAMVIATDITQQKQAEQELVRRRAELAHLSRLSTMGELAAELSHELNQPLAAINNYTNGCIRRIRSQTTTLNNLIDPLEEISRQSQRASETIKRLRRHVQKSEVEQKPVDCNLVVKNAISLLEHEIQRNFISLHLELNQNPLITTGDAIQIEQVLVNLLLNAIEAMSELPADKRHLMIESEQDADNLVICVTDSGVGLKKGEEASIFETFYTTKQKGLGVGLAISQTIVEAHGGKLYPRRNQKGTSFIITLPITSGDYSRGT